MIRQNTYLIIIIMCFCLWANSSQALDVEIHCEVKNITNEQPIQIKAIYIIPTETNTKINFENSTDGKYKYTGNIDDSNSYKLHIEPTESSIYNKQTINFQIPLTRKKQQTIYIQAFFIDKNTKIDIDDLKKAKEYYDDEEYEKAYTLYDCGFRKIPENSSYAAFWFNLRVAYYYAKTLQQLHNKKYYDTCNKANTLFKKLSNDYQQNMKTFNSENITKDMLAENCESITFPQEASNIGIAKNDSKSEKAKKENNSSTTQLNLSTTSRKIDTISPMNQKK